MSSPRTVEVTITGECNLRCKYCCFFTSTNDVGQDLSTEEWLKFFDELGQAAVMEISFMGGEPFLRGDLKELINGVISNRMRFRIASNGTLISEEMAKFLASVSHRCNGIQISIDSATSEIHDLYRGKNKFSKAVESIKILKEYNVPVFVRVTINKSNVKELETIAHFLLEEMGLKNFSTNSVSPIGLGQRNAKLFELSIEEQSLAMKTFLKLNKKYPGRIQALAGPKFSLENWSAMEQSRKGEKSLTLKQGGYLGSCGNAWQALVVRSDGVMIPCGLLAHVELGRINEDNLKEVWQDHLKLQKLRKRFTIPLSEFEYCRGCDYINFCRGGSCPALSLERMGCDDHPIPDACFKRFLLQGGQLPMDGN